MFAPDPEFLSDELKRLLLSAPVRQWLKYECADPDAAAIPVRNETIDDMADNYVVNDTTKNVTTSI